MIIHCRLTRSMASTVPMAIPDGASVKEIDEKDFPTKEQHQEVYPHSYAMLKTKTDADYD